MLAHEQEMQQLASTQRDSLDSLNRQHMSALQRRDAQLHSLTQQHQAQLDALNRHDRLKTDDCPSKPPIIILIEAVFLLCSCRHVLVGSSVS